MNSSSGVEPLERGWFQVPKFLLCKPSKAWRWSVKGGNVLCSLETGWHSIRQEQRVWPRPRLGPSLFRTLNPAAHIQHRRKSFCTQCHTSPSMGQSVHSTSPVADAGTEHQRERARQETGTVSGPRVSLYYTLHFLIRNLSQSKSIFWVSFCIAQLTSIAVNFSKRLII